MKVHVANHPLISHKLTILRDEKTDSPTFRLLVEELVTLLAYEATREVRTTSISIKTPVTATTGLVLAEPRPVVVPILRAGLGMLEGMTKLLPTAQVGFLGMVRNEETLQASTPMQIVYLKIYLVANVLSLIRCLQQVERWPWLSIT